MTKANQGRSFFYHEDNAFVERNVVAHHLSEVTRFFLALALVAEGSGILALPILRELLSSVNRVEPQFRDTVGPCYMEALQQAHKSAYDRLIECVGTAEADGPAKEGEGLLAEIVRVAPYPKQWDVSRAVYRFQLGDLAGARALVDISKRIFPRGSAPFLSSAFLYLWEGQHDHALREYRRAAKAPESNPDMVIGVVRFLGTISENRRDKPVLRFGLAYVCETMQGDTVQAEAEYERFLEESAGSADRSIDGLRKEAAQRLSVLRQEAPGAPA